MPVQSIITEPINGKIMNINGDDTTPIKGIAWSGAGRHIIKVECSVDNGNEWFQAEMNKSSDIKNTYQKEWGWTLWNINIPNKYLIDNKKDGKVKILCRAMDSGFNSQPSNKEACANGTMYLNNSYHTIFVVV